MTLRRKAPHAQQRWLTLTISVGAAVLLVASAVLALAGTDFDAFDGNLENNPVERDWVDVGIDCVDDASPVGDERKGCGLDLPTGTSDNSFGQGTKEDTPVPTVVDGSIPNNKSDLLRFYVANEKVGPTDFLYLAWERVQEPNGTTNMDFEFNQSNVLSSNGVTPNRTAGDVLIKYDLSQGGTNPTLGYHKWVTTGNAAQVCEASNSLPCWDKVHALTGFFEGSVNSPDAVTDPIPPNAPRSLSARTFGEAAINLTDSNILPGGGASCAGFGSAYLKSRSSDSFTAALKDFIAPIPVNISNCGRIIIDKVAYPSDSTSFSFSLTGGPDSINQAFGLTDAATPHDSGEIKAGTYSAAETVPDGWDLIGSTCSDGSAPSAIALSVGETVTCTFTNVKDAKVTIVKEAVPEGATDFGYTGDFGAFTLEDDGNTADEPATPGDGGDWPKSTSFTIQGADFPAGGGAVTKAVTETGVTNWDLTDITCTGGGANTSDTGSTATIGVDPGEDITCTFTNVQDAKVTIVKQATPEGGTNFPFTGTIGIFTLEDDGDETNEPVTPGTGGDWPQTKVFAIQGADFPTGGGTLSRTAIESAVTDWDLTDITCTGGGANTSDTGSTATIGIDPGEDIACTFTNVKDAKVTIVKDASPTSGTDFPFTGDLGVFTLEDDGSTGDEPATPGMGGDWPTTKVVAFQGADLAAGALTKLVTESAVSGWTLTDITCTGGGANTSDTGSTATIGVDPGEDITCTFTNVSQHVVIVIVCHEGTLTLAASAVTIGSDQTTLTTSLATGVTLPDGVSEAELCGLGGARYAGLSHEIDKQFLVDIGSNAH